MGVSKFRDRRVHDRNTGMKEFKHNKDDKEDAQKVPKSQHSLKWHQGEEQPTQDRQNSSHKSLQSTQHRKFEFMHDHWIFLTVNLLPNYY